MGRGNGWIGLMGGVNWWVEVKGNVVGVWTEL